LCLAKTPFNKSQLALLRTCPILSTTTDEDTLVHVPRDAFAAFYDCCPTIDARLLRGGAFMAPGARPKEAAALLQALGVEFLDEIAFYSKVLMPHLQDISAAECCCGAGGGGGGGAGRVGDGLQASSPGAPSAGSPWSRQNAFSWSSQNGVGGAHTDTTQSLLPPGSPIAGEDELDFVDMASDTGATGTSSAGAASASGRGVRAVLKRSIFGSEEVLADFLEETLARIDTRYDKPGSPLEGFSERYAYNYYRHTCISVCSCVCLCVCVC